VIKQRMAAQSKKTAAATATKLDELLTDQAALAAP